MTRIRLKCLCASIKQALVGETRGNARVRGRGIKVPLVGASSPFFTAERSKVSDTADALHLAAKLDFFIPECAPSIKPETRWRAWRREIQTESQTL